MGGVSGAGTGASGPAGTAGTRAEGGASGTGSGGGIGGALGGIAGEGASGGTGAGGNGGTPCNTLAISGPLITQMAALGSAPMPAGGTIGDGTYVMTRYDVYAPASPSASPIKATIRVAGNQLDYATGTDTLMSNATYSTSTSGTTWFLTGTCPVAPTTQGAYTATPTAIMLFSNPDRVQVFAIQ